MRLNFFRARHHKTKTNASSSQQMPDSQRQENRNTITSGNSTSSSGSSSSSVNGKSAANTKPVPAQASTEIRHAHSLWSLAFTGRLGRSSPLWLRHLKSSQRAEAAVTTRERSQRSHGSLVLRALASLTGRTLLAWEPWQSLASPAVLAPAGLLLTAGLQVALEMQISLGIVIYVALSQRVTTELDAALKSTFFFAGFEGSAACDIPALLQPKVSQSLVRLLTYCWQPALERS